MSEKQRILMIGTYGIDVFHGITEAFEGLNCIAIEATTHDTAKSYLGHHSFDAILINLEPDGRGLVAGIEFLEIITESPLQQDSVCFGISSQSLGRLLSSSTDSIRLYSMLAACLTLPIVPLTTSQKILQITQSPGHLRVKDRFNKTLFKSHTRVA